MGPAARPRYPCGGGDRSGPPNAQLPRCPTLTTGWATSPSWVRPAKWRAGTWPSTCPWSAGPCLGDPGLPRPIPCLAGRWDQEREGHASARHIPARPPCPHAHGCQLEQKTHPQVAISNRAGPSPSADDRLRALLRPACRPLRGRGGWAHPSARGLPACPCLPPVPPQGHTPHLRPGGPGRLQRPQVRGGRAVARGQEAGGGGSREASWPRIRYGGGASTGLRAGGGGQWGANLSLASTPSLFQNHGTRWACSCGLPAAGRARGPWSEGQSLSQPGTLLWALSTHRHTPAARTCLCTLRPHLAGASLLPAPTQFPARTAQRPGRPGFGPHRAAGGLACRSPHPPGPRTAH